MFKGNIRGVCIRAYSSKARVGKPFKNAEEIKQYLSTPSWNAQDLLKFEANDEITNHINKQMLEKLLKLTGLSTDISADQETALISALKAQVLFVNQLHSVEVEDEFMEATNNKGIGKPITYEDLLSQIKQLKPSESKGEVSNSWNPSKLADTQDGFFIVKEGLGERGEK